MGVRGAAALTEPVDCEIWSFDSERGPKLDELLDDTERGRRDSFVFAADQRRFVAAAATLRLVAGSALGIAPERVQVQRYCPDCCGPHGKPEVEGLHLSLSHSGPLAVVAIAPAPVGVDVEEQLLRDTDGLFDTILNPVESAGTAADFYRIWCRKESVVKATGAGLRVPLVEVVVSAAAEPPRLLSYQGAALPAGIADFAPRPGWAGAVTVIGAGAVRPIQHRAVDLLAAC